LVDETLAALADPARRRIVELLINGPQRAGAIAEQLAMTPAASSRHLRQLHSQHLVAVEPDPADARGRLYALQADRLIGLSAWLDQVHAHWSDQLASFKRHAEATERDR
jgi:DNA-binding transcriptional ArsR family regulator